MAMLSSLLAGDMDPGWRDDCAALTRRLEAWARRLDELGGTADEEKAEGGVALEPGQGRGWLSRPLVAGMLAEIRVMEQTEREVVAAEIEWVQSMIRADDGADDGGHDNRRAGAIWRLV